MGMQRVSIGVEEKREKCKKSYVEPHHRVEHFLTSEIVGKPGEYERHEKGHGQDGPDFQKRDRLGARVRGGHDERLFGGPEYVIVETDQERHEKHGNKFTELFPMHRP
jgi:hypothetical protein